MNDDPVPRLELDPLELRRQQQRLLASMFGERPAGGQGQVLEHYELLRELGRGSMGVVHLAHDRKLDRQVAIKQIASADDPELRRRLIGEAQAMAKLAHPNVMPVYEIGEVDDASFIVMAYVEGVSLRAWLQQAPRSQAEILAVFRAAGQGLAAAHAKGIVHRDFKPDNVIVGDDGRVMVMDFGVARVSTLPERDEPMAEDSADIAVEAEPGSSMTRTGHLVGTPAYMAAEQLRGEPATPASDQFGFCVALHEALYGVRPFVASGLAQLRELVEAGPSTSLVGARVDVVVPAWLRAIVMRGLAPTPEQRHASMDALLDALARGDRQQGPTRVFVAYRGPDAPAVLRLCEDLLAQGVRTWLDLWERADPLAELAAAEAVLVCHGPHGWPESDALADRIAADPSSVWCVELPRASTDERPRGWPELPTCSIDDAAWETSVAQLGDRIRRVHARGEWLAEEAHAAGLEVDALCPYPGLAAFGEADARWMFGRARELDELIVRLRASTRRFVSVVGASGSGKTSLVRAGLCPALRRGALDGEDTRAWTIAVLRPGPRPCEALARALLELRGASPDADAIARLRTAMLDDAGGLRAGLNQANATRMLLIVDRLEELFSEADLAGDRREVIAFVDNLARATRGDTSLWIVATLRADFMHRCLELRGLARALQAGTSVMLAPMTKPQVRAAIELPARRVGYELDAELTAELVAATADQPGHLPLLQHALREAWQLRDREARRMRHDPDARTTGLEAAIAKAAEAALEQLRDELGEPADAVLRRVLMRLVVLAGGVGGAGLGRRRARRDELGLDPITRRVLTVLIDEARVLVASERDGVEVVELAHDALLHEWPTLASWIDADREALHVRQALRSSAEQYASRRDAEYLWGRGRVDEAKRVLALGTVELVAREREFLERSEQRARQRERLLWGAVAAAVLVLVGLVSVGAWLLRENQRQADDNRALAASAQSQRERVEDVEQAQRGLRASMLAPGRMDLEPTLLAIEALGAYGPSFERLPPADVVQATLDVLAMPGVIGPIATLEGHTGDVVAVAFSPDGRTLASGSLDGSVRLWDPSSGRELARLDGHTRSVSALAFSPDGARLVSASWDRSARVWDLASRSSIAVLEGHTDDVLAAVFSPDGTRVATASSDDSARIWDASTGELLARLEGHQANVVAVVFSPDGTRVATASHDASVGIWAAAAGGDTKASAPLRMLSSASSQHGSDMLDVRFSPDGARVLGCSRDGIARIWDAQTGAALASLAGHRSSVTSAVFSPDGTRVATASTDDSAMLWDADTGERLASFVGHTDDVVALAFWAGGTRLITASLDDSARVWDVRDGRELATLVGHADDLLALALDDHALQGIYDHALRGIDGARFATAGADADVRVWELGSEPQRMRLTGHRGAVRALVFAPDGARLYSAGDDGSVRIWSGMGNGERGESSMRLDGHTGAVGALVRSPGGTHLASAGSDASVRLWDALTGESLAVFEGHTSHVAALAFSPDGTRLASASYDASARMWGVSSHERLALYEGHRSYVVALAFSPDGTKLATAGYDARVGLWDANIDEQSTLLRGHEGYVVALAFAPDGASLASASWDHDLRIWNVGHGSVAQGSARAVLAGHDDRVLALAYAPDGSQLASAGADGELRLWDPNSGRVLQVIEGHGDAVVALAYAPDGRLLASASTDDSVRLWDPGSGRAVATLSDGTGDVEAIAFAPDASVLAAAGADGSIRLWPMPATALRMACDRAAPYLSRARVARVCDR